MPTLATKQFQAWSASRLRDWKKCPLSARLKHLDRISEGEESPALRHGNEMHRKCQRYAIGKGNVPPKELKLFNKEFRELHKLRKSLHVEQQVAFNKKWGQVEWYAKEAWLRVVFDCWYDTVVDGVRIRHVIDYKTGKFHPENDDQLELFAVAAFCIEPVPVTVEAALWYLDEGVASSKTYTDDAIVRLKARWENEAAAMLRDKTFKPKPSNACRWCAYSKEKGGQCKF